MILFLTNFKTNANGTTTETPEEKEELRLWSIDDSPEETSKTFHPVRMNVISRATPVAATPANTIISNQTSMIISVNNGCGCGRHSRTTTESPPSDLITRVIKYRKNMAMYRQTAEAAIRRKKKEGEKNRGVDKKFQGSEDNGNDDGDDENTTSAPNEVGDVEYKAAANPMEYLTMAIFLRKVPKIFISEYVMFLVIILQQ